MTEKKIIASAPPVHREAVWSGRSWPTQTTSSQREC